MCSDPNPPPPHDIPYTLPVLTDIYQQPSGSSTSVPMVFSLYSVQFPKQVWILLDVKYVILSFDRQSLTWPPFRAEAETI